MSKHPSRTFRRLFAPIQPLWRRRVWITAMSVAGSVLVLRSTGLLQFLEWAAFDQFFRLRPPESVDERIVIVTIDERDLQKVGKWPLPDAVIAELLQKLQSHNPRAIGLDIYRDLPVEPGQKELVKAYTSIPNLIGIEQLPDKNSIGVPPPLLLNQRNQVSFNNIVVDADGKVRRGLLYWTTGKTVYESFALKLALIYLKPEGITPKTAKNSQNLQLGRSEIRSFMPNDGAYVRADAGGYQFIANFKQSACQGTALKTCSFRTVSLDDVLTDRVPLGGIRDRVVLIGSTAPSLKDFFYTPYSGSLVKAAQPTAGVTLQANFVSQILSAALIERPLMQAWSDSVESLWIFVWGWAGASLSWQLRRPIRSTLSILIAASGLIVGSYLAFTNGWWLPLVPSLFALGGSAVVSIAYIAHLEEELRRSKEFLYQVINTISDPIFVKNREHRWVVLNKAFSCLIGYPLEVLVEKSGYDFFPKHEADTFFQQDEQVFQRGTPSEHEEEFTDARGIAHLIATKRSLHRDAAGNLFLVGVIRDITERKRTEEELRRTATELFRSNTELKLSEDRLRYLARHDPLTGLPNRQLFYEHLNQSLAWTSRNNLLLALLFIDLDGFKQVNDTLGHTCGDCLLKEVAQRLKGCLRGSDTVSRWGGDEFTVILSAIPKVQVAATVAEKILAALMQVFILNEHHAFITASIGISLCPLNSQDGKTLIEQADMAMYQAKQGGKNRYEFARSLN